jgi:hypothetical protein
MKKNKKMYNWHFWIPDWEIQIIIDKSSFAGAVSHLKDKLSYYNRPSPKFEFQFGQLIDY